MPEISETRFKSLLHLALRFKSDTISKAFLRVGADNLYQYSYAFRLVSSKTKISEIVEALVKAGADVNVQEEKGNTALHLAAERENSGCVEALTEADADVNLQNIEGCTALHLASGSSITTLTEILTKAGAEINIRAFDGSTALHKACTARSVRNVELLIKAGADVNVMASNGWSALHFILDDFPNCYLRDYDCRYLYEYVYEIVKLLIDAGIDVNHNSYGGTALHRAVTLRGNVKLVEELIRVGADVNIQNDSGETALHVAYISNDRRYVQILKEAGVDVNKQNRDGDTALHIASKTAANETVRELIVAGVDINRQNYIGDTSLHHNISGFCNFEVLEILITNGACVNIKNKHGLDPLQCAKHNNSLLGVCKLHEHFKLYRDAYGNTIFHFLFKYCYHAEEVATLIRARQLDFAKYLNVQNMFGQTPLHIAASKKLYSGETLNLIFSNFDKCELDLLVVDENGNTFFHTYLSSFWSSYYITFIKRFLGGEYINCSKAVINKLVQLRNRTGHAPFHVFVNEIPGHHEVLDIKLVLEMFLKAGANINLCNSLGETVLHSLINSFCKQYAATELAVENGAEVNIQNIFGESPIFVVPSCYDNIKWKKSDCTTRVKLLVKYGVKMDVCNKIGQTPLIVHMMKPCLNFRNIISMFENNVDISKQDIYGSNLLHYIAWTYSFEISVNFDLLDLLNWPGFRVLQDNRGLLPCDVAYLRGHKNVLDRICICKNGVHKEELVFSPAKILFWSLKQKDDVFQNCVQTKRKYFSEVSIRNIMNEPFVGLVKYEGEAKAIETAVVSIVKDICRRIGEKDELLTNTVIKSGSVAENTKVGLPDEFDFLCVLNKMPELFDIEESIDTSYVNLKLKEVHRGTARGRFFGHYPYFSISQSRLLDRFRDVLQEIMQMSDIYRHTNIFHVKHGVQEPRGSPNFALTFIWCCCKYKNMTVKIDLVPVCQITCPPDSKFYSNTLNPNTNENEGLFILFQNIFVSPGSSRIITSHEHKARTSAANAERKLLNALQQDGRDAYVISKILCCDRVCPSVVFMYRACRKRNPTCASIVSSFMLKNCLFHVAKEESAETLSKLSVHGYVCKIFEKLLQCSLEGNLPCYMFPCQNLFTFQSRYNEHDISITCMCRVVYAKIILNILGKNEYFNDISPMVDKLYIQDTPELIKDNDICANCKKNPDQHGIILETCFRCKLWTYCSAKCQEENLDRHKLACDYHYNNLCQSVSDQ
ncbi:serine/threonine-protein phosphatase 6 regulatory ankyrin repeat subunit A-like [Mercenaria mercenaria]|uniref:serine/threonine-protein phosphatase 6 regulatory ankyrin repeat subunit A-like n=1 Tax=Mercenaria mercenaria TaxID=6596 RepID=UPI00234E9AF3|nr:serine/threonine-protein phosphatase 6 regulatory ankyrin repeat subunit A-like [Mercenaria mercenaria]